MFLNVKARKTKQNKATLHKKCKLKMFLYLYLINNINKNFSWSIIVCAGEVTETLLNSKLPWVSITVLKKGKWHPFYLSIQGSLRRAKTSWTALLFPCAQIDPSSCTTDIFPLFVVILHASGLEQSFNKLVSVRKQRPSCVHSTGAKRTRSRSVNVRGIQTAAPLGCRLSFPAHSG